MGVLPRLTGQDGLSVSPVLDQEGVADLGGETALPDKRLGLPATLCDRICTHCFTPFLVVGWWGT